MILSVQDLVPIPLKQKVAASASQVWRQSLQLEQGQRVYIQAPSGKGKTTLMHILYGLRTDYEGTVNWDDTEMGKADAPTLSALRSSKISIILQDMRLFPDLTAWENLEVKNVLHANADSSVIQHYMERLGIGDIANRRASQLSYGEQQRVAIIRALLQPFNWLLMDEPFSHLDRQNTDKAIALIHEIVAANRAGLLLADLDDTNHFDYSKKLLL